jgi:hypothetical protein
MLKGFAIIPTLLGRIAIGEVIEKNGKKLPNKLDHIVITGMAQGNDGGWAEHPVMTKQLKVQATEKLRSIPVRILFDTPENNFHAEYTCFDNKGRPMCSGNGETAKRRTDKGIEGFDCPGSDLCDYGAANRCKPFGRLIVGMESGFEHDPLAGFIFRTTSFNSIRSLTARLSFLGALTGNKLSGLPCNLRMRAKSTSASFRKPIYYLDLEPAGGLFAATKAASDYHALCSEKNVNLTALDLAVKEGLAASAFFEDSQDGEEVVEEFYNPEVVDPETGEIVIRKVKSPAQQVDPATTEKATEAQVVAIKALLESTGKGIGKLNQWLGRTVDTTVEDLTSAEASRAIEVMTPKVAA